MASALEMGGTRPDIVQDADGDKTEAGEANLKKDGNEDMVEATPSTLSNNYRGAAADNDEEAGSKAAFLISSGAKTLSAGLYLADYVTNILSLWQYYKLHKGHTYSGAIVYFSNIGPVPFIVCLVLMVLDPIVAAVVFKMKLSPQEHPLKSAFFLPIVQFHRFVAGIFRTGSCASKSKTMESDHTEALYAAMVAVETGPQIVLQFTVIMLVSFSTGGSDGYWIPSPILIISLIFSFVSAAFNISRAVMCQLSEGWTFTFIANGIGAGMCMFGTLLLRCTTVASIAVVVWNDIIGISDGIKIKYNDDIGRFESIPVVYFGVGIGLLSYFVGLYLVFKKEGGSICSWVAYLEILIATYIIAAIGPFYLVLEGDLNEKIQNSKRPFWRHFVVLTIIYMLPNVVVLTTLSIGEKTSCGFHRIPLWGTRELSNNTVMTCRIFKNYVAVGIALSILPPIIILICQEHTSKVTKKIREVQLCTRNCSSTMKTQNLEV